MKSSTAAFILFLLSMSEMVFAGGWVLMGLEVKYNGEQITATTKSVELESFATAAACNNQRSAWVQELGKQAREMRDMKDRSAVQAAEKEITLLFFIYSNSKCVPSP